MIIRAQNEAPLVPDQSILQIPREQAPLGNLEGLRQEIPYQEGFIGDLWELGYIPQNLSSVYLTIAFVILSLFFFVFLRKKIQNRVQLAVLYLFTLLALGPIRLFTPIGIRSLYGVVRLGGLLLAIFLVFRLRKTKLPLLFSSPLLAPLLLYTTAVLLSYPHVLNSFAFFSSLKLLITGYLFFLVGFFSVQKIADLKLYAVFFAYAAGFVSLLMFLGFLFQNLYKSAMRALYPLGGYLKFLFDLNRGRLTPIWDIEFFGHFLLHRFVFLRTSLRWLAPLPFFLLSFVVLLSNTRYRVLILLFSLLAYLIVSQRIRIFKRLLLPAFFLLLVYVGISNLVFDVNVFERFLLSNPETDRIPLLVRSSMAQEAIAMAVQFPLTGVGLGNYGEYVTFKYRWHGHPFDPFYRLVVDVYQRPHSWFFSTVAEVGLLGFSALIWLLWRMLKEDRHLLRMLSRPSDRTTVLLFMVPTWAYLLGNAITDLYSSLALVILFWFFRGTIHRIFMVQIGVR